MYTHIVYITCKLATQARPNHKPPPRVGVIAISFISIPGCLSKALVRNLARLNLSKSRFNRIVCLSGSQNPSKSSSIVCLSFLNLSKSRCQDVFRLNLSLFQPVQTRRSPHTSGSGVEKFGDSIYLSIYIYIYISLSLYIYIYTYTYVYIYIYIYKCIYISLGLGEIYQRDNQTCLG